jgi:hypothetical protein
VSVPGAEDLGWMVSCSVCRRREEMEAHDEAAGTGASVLASWAPEPLVPIKPF